jgi:hypothetical protein
MKLAYFSTGNNYLDPSIENYVMHGLQPGGFLTAVIMGDSVEAKARADHWNRLDLSRIMALVDCYLPPAAKGSYQAVTDWIKDVDNRRTNYVAEVEKQRVLDRLGGEMYDNYLVKQYDHNY